MSNNTFKSAIKSIGRQLMQLEKQEYLDSLTVQVKRKSNTIVCEYQDVDGAIHTSRLMGEE